MIPYRTIASLIVEAAAMGLLAGCNPTLHSAHQAAEASGNARMHEVADAYADDPEKLKAATFLLEGLSGHGTYTFDLVTASGEVAPYSLYRPGVTAENYRDVVDSLGVAVRYRQQTDAETLTPEYLMRNIDLAFRAWRENPWSQHYPPAIFQAYILPYRIGTEELTDWRTFFIERYTPMIDTMTGPRDVRSVARLIIRDVKSWFGFHDDALLLKPALTAQEAFLYGKGECGSIANIFVLALRAMGIAATVDVIPVWGTSNGGHAEAVYFDEDGNPVMLGTGDWLAAQPPKVYRTEFRREREPANILGNPFYRDVTAEYVATSDITLTFDSEPETAERAALAVFGNERWRPIVAGEECEQSKGRYFFERVGRSILYLPVWVDGRSVRVAGRPFHLDPRGNIQYYGTPDTTRRVDVDLTPLIRPEDRGTFRAEDYYIAYWHGDRWQPCASPIAEILADDSVKYSVTGLPERCIYGIFRKDNGRTYYRRIFRSWKTTPTRF